jgi:DNA-binding transcriptional regulator YdaS (Cro superfamily)
MKKKDVIKLFGSLSNLARAIGISPQAVSQWPDELTPAIRDRVIAAAVRIGCPLTGVQKPEGGPHEQ